MSVRLSKAIKELNIGLSTAVDFLSKKGHEVESNPNTKLTDDEYFLLAKEFNKDMAVKLESEKLIQKRQSKEKNKSKALDGFLERNPEKKEKLFTAKAADEMPHIKTVGHIDIDNPDPSNLKKTLENTVEETEKKAAEKTIESSKEKEDTKTTDTPAEEKVEKEENSKIEKNTVEESPKTDEIKEEKSTTEKSPEIESKEKGENESSKKVKDHIVLSTDSENINKKDINIKEEKVFDNKTKPIENEKKDQKEAAKKDQVQKKEEKAQLKVEEDKKTEVNKTNTNTNTNTNIEDKKKVTDSAEKNNKTEDDVFRPNEPVKLSGPVVTGSIDLDKINSSTRPKPSRNKRDKRKKVESKGHDKNANSATDNDKNKPAAKRKRINKKRVDVNKSTPPTNNKRKTVNKDRNKKPVKTEVDQEAVQKQIKETLARLSRSNKKRGKSARYRQERREQANAKLQEQEDKERKEEKILKLTEFVTVNELATMMDVSVNEVIGTCMSIGMMVSINQRLDAETINIVADEFGFSTEYVSDEVVEALQDSEEPDSEEDLEPRAPIVTVMGHVDHGKTSLLDYIRNTNVIAGEAGGITQHIGAYNVKLKNGQRITFLDTPGHEAFTAMRARGAKITDIAIIIVAADDDVMPQTKEAINHAAAANVPIVFAINKIDKPGANPDRIKESLANMNYLVEDWGGKYQSQDISAKKGEGIRELLEKVLLEAELLELKANPKRRAVGSIIESSLDKGRGYVTTLLVQNGSLRVGDNLIAGTYHGKIKAMFNERNQPVEVARPAEPVLILGMNGAPQAGDMFNEVETEQEAKEIAHKRELLQREQSLRTKKHFTLDELGRRIALGDFQELNIIVKGDVDGSIEALSDTLIKLSTEHIQVNVIHKAVGAISDSDILLAAASNAIIIGFQVRPTASARRMAEKEEIDIRLYSIIYDAVEEIKSAMEGMLAPVTKEQVTATVEVLEVFKITKVGTVAGCIVKDGKVNRSNSLRIIRDGIVIYTGEIDTLKRHKDDVKEVGTNFECGISVKNYNDIKVGDLFETFESVEVKQTL